ncbi:hypothetical protein KPH14_003618 [Odynerus spinipes]|uniref:Uncharacterized protein n=1 Tax=Odynerus spinipes TaxID=1348599 RepID=A0AAD9VK36_9HYME|nr:hypothetical protein KPH14_003618 [Odynerus spinipes]
MSNDDGEELKERILDEGRYIEVTTLNELKRSQCEIKSVKKALDDIENKTWTCRNRYKSLMNDLKMDVHKTEQEIEFLQSQVSNLSRRREELKKEVTKQQEEYEKMLIHFTKDLENKGAGCGTPT